MFGKITQFKNFMTHAVTSLPSQRPSPPSDAELQQKLRFLLDYIFRQASEQQFQAYHSLQSPEMTLNQLLRQIYQSQSADTTQINSILHFFTFLLLNCKNELVLCKIVSDSFVVELTEVHLDSLGRGIVNHNVEIEEINSYKIALIKAYVSRINPETIKYMVLNDRMRIFENCVSLYEQYIQVEEQHQFGVEATCISNCILLIIRQMAIHPENSLNICNREDGKGVVYLLVRKVKNIHTRMLQILNQTQEDAEQFQFLKDKILFLIDIFTSISVEETKTRIISQTSKELEDLRELFKEIVIQHAAILNQSEQNYIKNLELIKVLLQLLAIYYDADALLPVFQECSLPLLHKFITAFKVSCRDIFLESAHVIKAEQVTAKELETLLAHKIKMTCIFCSNMEILACIIKSGQYLSRRNKQEKQEKKFKTVVTNILIDVIELLLSEEGEPIQQMLCFKSIKLLLFSVMQLTIQDTHALHDYTIVKLHQFAISKLKKHLKRSELWDYVVLHYEEMVTMVSHNLLLVEDSQPLEYSFCQFHDPSKQKEPQQVDALANSILINECARNFRYMMVERTKVALKDIKLEKNYHTNFITPGWNLEPGTEIGEEMKEVCQLTHFSRGIKIPISVIEDEECLLFCQGRKVIVNIRYKSIEGFFVEKEVVHIKLKGLQEILVKAESKNNHTTFKEYLSKGRDHSRERELKFLHSYLDIYYSDNQAVILEMGQVEIQEDTDSMGSPVKENTSHKQMLPEGQEGVEGVEGDEGQDGKEGKEECGVSDGSGGGGVNGPVDDV